MSTVKISQLPPLDLKLIANTSNSLFMGVDLTTGTTGKFTAHSLAKNLYFKETLNVGNNEDEYPNTIAQFAGTSNNYIQVNLENVNNDYGTADYVVGANTGSDTTYYLSTGYANRLFNPNYSYNGLGTSLYPLDGYMYVQGDTGQPGGNLVIGTTTTGKQIRFIAGGINSSNIIGYIDNTGIHFQSIDSMVSSNHQSSLSYTDTANTFLRANDTVTLTSAKSYTDTANTWLQANDTVTLTSAKSYTDTANTYIQSNYLANTSGTFNGNLTIQGVANVRNTLTIANSAFDYSNTALVSIVGSTGGVIEKPLQDGYMLSIVGKDGVPSRFINTSYGTNAFALLGGRKANGTAASPTAVANNDVMVRIGSNGHNGNNFVIGGQSRIDFIAAENYTTANNGSRIEFWNTPLKSNVITKIASFNGESAEFTGVVNPQKGFIYNPNVINGNITSLNLDMANNSIYKVSCNTNLNITVSGFQAGKVTEVWLTHFGNNNDTITHGCNAGNATKSGTSFNVNIPTLVYLRYFSVDGDLANTYVSINYG